MLLSFLYYLSIGMMTGANVSILILGAYHISPPAALLYFFWVMLVVSTILTVVFIRYRLLPLMYPATFGDKQ